MMFLGLPTNTINHTSPFMDFIIPSFGSKFD
jgi:hypothetical protein